ncbi:hypothetical protein HYR99_10325 [Candidatus Poribacteria bacterium]|nr:hypothetical protein [Candidatus Poribacteria bacterium]
MDTKHQMLCWILIIYLLIVSLPALSAAQSPDRSGQALPRSFDKLRTGSIGVMKFRAEGASRVENADTRKALLTAKVNALKKAFESQLNTLVLLTATERTAMTQKLVDEQKRFIIDVQTVTETVDDEMARVVLAGELLSEPLLNSLIDAGFLSRFKQKPRLVIAINEQHQEKPNPKRPFTILLRERLAALNLSVLPVELPMNLTEVSDGERVKRAHDAGGDVVIVGEATTQIFKLEEIGDYLSCRAVVDISALRTDTGEALHTMQEGAGGMGLTETEAIQRAYGKIPPDDFDRFAKDLLTKWLIGVAKQEIAPNDAIVGTPPRIQIYSPQDGEVVDTDTIRLQGSAVDDTGIQSVQLFVNGIESPLTSTHLIPSRRVNIRPTASPSPTLDVPQPAQALNPTPIVTEGQTSPIEGDTKAYQISRLIPLNPGNNIIRLVAQDTDHNRTEVKLTVLRLAPVTEAPGSADADVALEVYTPADGETIASESVTVRRHVKSDQPIGKIQVFVNGLETFTTAKSFAVEGLEAETPPSETPSPAPASILTELSFQRTISLFPGSNRIEVIATTERGKTVKQHLMVIRSSPPTPPSTDGAGTLPTAPPAVGGGPGRALVTSTRLSSALGIIRMPGFPNCVLRGRMQRGCTNSSLTPIAGDSPRRT